MSELTGCITKTKAQDLEVPLSLAHDKSGFVTVTLINLCLPVSPMEVATAKVLTAIGGVQTGINFGQWKLVLFDEVIDLATVYAKLHGAILLAHHHHIRTPWRSRWLNDVMLEHMLHMLVNERRLHHGLTS